MTVPSKKISTWRERIGQTADFPLHVPTDVERAMVAEIADLRTAVAAPAPAAGTERTGLRQALLNVRHAIQFSYDSVGGIDQMPVMMQQSGTVVEFIDGVLSAHAAQAADSTAGVHHD